MFSLLTEGPYVCVNCGFPYNKDVYKISGSSVKFHSRSPSTAGTTLSNEVSDTQSKTHRLTKCEQCGKLVDEYVQLDYNILFLDAILQKQSFYRHILLNCQVSNKNALKMAIIFCLCEAFQRWTTLNGAVSATDLKLGNSSNLISSKTYFQLEVSFYIIFLRVIFENALFNVIFYLNFHLFYILLTKQTASANSHNPQTSRQSLIDIFLALILCSYGKLFLIPSYLYAGELRIIVDTLIQLFCFLSLIQCASVKGHFFLSRVHSLALVAFTVCIQLLLLVAFRHLSYLFPINELLEDIITKL